MSYLISPSRDSLDRALDSWQWLQVGGEPIAVTVFADVFFLKPDGIWFLDTLEGTFKKSHDTKEELNTALASAEGQDHYLFAGFVDRARNEGQLPGLGECLDFKLHPRVGGVIKYSNVEVRDFVVALHIRGQLHEQTKDMPDGTKINKFVLAEEAEKKPWWKRW